MSQYLNLFATSLVSDGRRLRLHKAGVVSHIVVACKGAFHALTISDGRSIASYQEIRRALGEIIARAGDPAMAERSNSPALLVCAPGEMQIGTFELAKQYPENRRSLELLTSAFLVLCLDLDDLPDSAAEAALMAHARNVENRWYRASMQLVVFGNARACVIANPAASLSGNVMVRGAGEIQRNAEMSIDSEENGIAVPPAEGLKWTIHQSQLDLAARCWKALCNPQPATFQIDGEWKRTFEQHGLAPVCVFVVALQWAIRRLIGEVPVIDQFLAMTRFRYLTLKTAQVSTPEVLACCDYIDAGGYHAGMAASLLKRAAQSQAQACRNARKKMDLWWAWNLFLLDASRYADVKHIRWVAERFSAPAESMKRPKHVLISHPKADPAVELIGRPGVLYPFAKYFTLHYQIADSTISCVLAPAQGWKVSTAAFKSALADCLSAISTILAGADGEQSGDALPGIAAHSDGLLQKVDQKRRPQ